MIELILAIMGYRTPSKRGSINLIMLGSQKHKNASKGFKKGF